MPRKKESKPPSRAKIEDLKTPKGMHDIIGDDYFSYQGFIEKAQEIALYYGFSPIETPILEKGEIFTRTIGDFTEIIQKEMYTLRTKGGDKLAMRPEGTASVMRAYVEHGMRTLPQPVMLFYSGPFFRHENPQRGRLREFRQFGLEVIGTDKSIADVIVIKVFSTILEEAGMSNLCVDINSLGDKECRSAYKKALTAYFRKYVGSLNTHEKELLRYNPLRLLDSKRGELQEIIEEAPESVDSLNAASKQHFKEVLEYLDSLDIAYNINSRLVRGLDYYSRTAFEFIENPADDNPSDEPPLALGGGGRYDYLAKALGARKDIPGVGGAIGIDRIIMHDTGKKLRPRILKKPKVFFIQLGFEAKLKSLGVIEILRKAHLPVKQSLGKDSLTVQLGIAEKTEIPWVIILGQKEVIEDSVIVRNMSDRSQKTVLIKDLPDYIKQVIAK
tara:strand:- start:300 stop:1631 length:1332 start_codon:yes stop_codon:yes gene_type:complete